MVQNKDIYHEYYNRTGFGFNRSWKKENFFELLSERWFQHEKEHGLRLGAENKISNFLTIMNGGIKGIT